VQIFLKSGILNPHGVLLYLLAKAIFLNNSSTHHHNCTLQDTATEFHEVGWLSENLKTETTDTVTGYILSVLFCVIQYINSVTA
jgi:hypothetical protein